jgi:hypothetical protein
MVDENTAPTQPDAKVTDEGGEEDEAAAEQKTSHPGYKYYRKTRQFGG